MERDRLADRHPIPKETDLGIEMPKKIVREGLRKQREHKHRDAWRVFMSNLSVGESFVVDNYTVQYVKGIAKYCEIDIVTSSLRDRYQTRIWVYGKPGERNPIYKKITVVQKVVREEIVPGDLPASPTTGDQ